MKKTRVGLALENASLRQVANIAKSDLLGAQRQRDYLQERIDELESLVSVLQSDRERLTSTVEVLSRRLASPAAEYNTRRIGREQAAYESAKVPVGGLGKSSH